MHARSIPGPESSLMQSLSGRTVNAQAIRHADGSIKEGGTNRDSSPSRTIQNRIDSLKSITPPALPEVDVSNMPMLTVDGLKAAWGETDSVYDLNSDGTVNVNDLLKLLAEGGTMHHPDAPITIEGVMLAMESGNLAYDVNKDGQVNVSDLLQVLAAQGEKGQASLDNMPLLTVDGLKAAWGETDSIYDLDSDGTVN
ncbi:MAG: dockerin type I domain-containing protein, partial [Planctomycetota bacterium]|nr:dockerin type I domain-containing protein [Planctomycetota bacterium]